MNNKDGRRSEMHRQWGLPPGAPTTRTVLTQSWIMIQQVAIVFCLGGMVTWSFLRLESWMGGVDFTFYEVCTIVFVCLMLLSTYRQNKAQQLRERIIKNNLGECNED